MLFRKKTLKEVHTYFAPLIDDLIKNYIRNKRFESCPLKNYIMHV